MSRFEDFFDKNPSSQHQQRVEQAVQEALLQNQINCFFESLPFVRLKSDKLFFSTFQIIL